MCNFIKSDNQKCQYKPLQEWCGYHDPSKHEKRVITGRSNRNKHRISLPTDASDASDVVQPIQSNYKQEIEELNETIKSMRNMFQEQLISMKMMLFDLKIGFKNMMMLVNKNYCPTPVVSFSDIEREDNDITRTRIKISTHDCNDTVRLRRESTRSSTISSDTTSTISTATFPPKTERRRSILQAFGIKKE